MKDTKKQKSEKVTKEFILEKERILKEILRQSEELLQKALAPPPQAQTIAKQTENFAKLLEETQRAIQPVINSTEEIQKSYEKLAKSFRYSLQPLIPKEEIMSIITREEDIMRKLLLLIDFLEKELMKN